MPFDHFNVVAGLFNRTAPFIPPQSLLDLLGLPSDSLLLDAGGGTGRVAIALRKIVRGVVVADLSRGMLRYAARKGLTTTCALAEHLPFASSTFDRIIMVDALHHLFEQHQAVSEFWRVLSPRGRIVIIEPNINKFAVKLIAIAEKLLFLRSHFLAADKIAALFENQNVQVRVVFNEFNVWVCAERVR
jgi:ubiquinone/menaquinone biosynthesis C-methylase UbiE